MQVRISWFEYSFGGKFSVSLELCVNWGNRSCLLREVRSPLALQEAPRESSCITVRMNRASYQVEVGTSGFLSISDIDLGVSEELKLESLASSCFEALNSAYLSSCSCSVRRLVELYLGPVAFLGGPNQ